MLKEINKFLATSRMTETRFGREAAKDPNLIRDLRNGRTLRPGTAAKIRDFIQNYRGDL